MRPVIAPRRRVADSRPLARLRAWLLAGLACSVTALAAAQAPAQDASRLQADVREATSRVPVQVQDAFGQPVRGELLVTTFRPPGAGPFPLAVISHGRSPDKRDAYKRQRYESAARFFVRKGFAVAVPLRLGYGELVSAGDPEDSVSCSQPRFSPALAAAAAQVLAVRDFMARQPDIDAGRTVLVGVSVGGIATIAATSAHVPGQVAAINFAGGHGGNPDKHPGEPCQADQLRSLYRAYGEGNARVAPATPTLWIYAENDRYFSPRHARRWAAAYADGGGAVDLRLLPAWGEDGHQLFSTGNDVWQPLVDDFLKPLGFDRPGRVAAPPAQQPLAGDASAPAGANAAELAGFQKFLAAKAPLAFCQRNTAPDADAGKNCHLYAVDEAVVRTTP